MIEGSYQDLPLEIARLEDTFVKSENTLLATSFIKNGAIASTGKNIKEVNLRS